MNKEKLSKLILRIEATIGVIAMLMGTILTVAVWNEGYFAGALMMVLTGILNMFLAVKELIAPTDGILHWQAVFFHAGVQRVRRQAAQG